MNVFISFDWDDRDQVNGFRGILSNPDVRELNHRDNSVKVDYTDAGAGTIRQHILSKIGSSDVTVCLISSKTRGSNWVNWELEASRRLAKPIVGIVLPDHAVKTNTGVPEFFQRYPACEWIQWSTPAVMNDAIRRANRA